jgi:hypothetical protein
MNSAYTFSGGYPDSDTVAAAHDAADLSRAVSCYRYFFPLVSGAMLYHGTLEAGGVPNRVFGTLDTRPRHVGFTLNSDTPYGPTVLDVSDGPFVFELPPGPILAVVLDIDQRWVADMGMPGPDAGNGGRHLILPPGYDGEIPDGYYVSRARSNHLIAGVRSLPVGGDVPAAIERLRSVQIHPLREPYPETSWIAMTPDPQDTTPLSVEGTLEFWRVLHKTLESEPMMEHHRAQLGELAALGIIKGQPFAPDQRRTRILTEAAAEGDAQLRVESFADDRPDRVVWEDRRWEWVTLVPGNGTFDTPQFLDTVAREVWFYQAVASSRRCFAEPQAPGRSTGWALAMRPAPTSTEVSTTNSSFPCRFRPSCSGASPSRTPEHAAKSKPNRERRRSGPSSRCPIFPRRAKWSSASDPHLLTTHPSPGSRPTPAKAGSPISASMAPKTRSSTEPGAPAISPESASAARVTEPTSIQTRLPHRVDWVSGRGAGRDRGYSGVPVELADKEILRQLLEFISR